MPGLASVSGSISLAINTFSLWNVGIILHNEHNVSASLYVIHLGNSIKGIYVCIFVKISSTDRVRKRTNHIAVLVSTYSCVVLGDVVS